MPLTVIIQSTIKSKSQFSRRRVGLFAKRSLMSSTLLLQSLNSLSLARSPCKLNMFNMILWLKSIRKLYQSKYRTMAYFMRFISCNKCTKIYKEIIKLKQVSTKSNKYTCLDKCITIRIIRAGSGVIGHLSKKLTYNQTNIILVTLF